MVRQIVNKTKKGQFTREERTRDAENAFASHSSHLMPTLIREPQSLEQAENKKAIRIIGQKKLRVCILLRVVLDR